MIYVLTKFKREYVIDNFPELIFASSDKKLVQKYYQELKLEQEYWLKVYEYYQYTYGMFRKVHPEPKPHADVSAYRAAWDLRLKLHKEFHDKFYPELAALFGTTEEEVKNVVSRVRIIYNIVEVPSD